MGRERLKPTVTVVARPIWRIRLTRELPRYLLQALAVMGLLASARFAIAPPHAVIARASAPSASPPDLAAQGFASLFARRYLTWDARDPEAHQSGLAQFVGTGMDGDAGLQVPTSGEQRVLWTEVVQERQPAVRERVYTVAVQTDSAGLLYLTVSVVRQADGELALAGYPAFVGAPASAAAVSPGQLREVQDPALATAVARALRNYLSASGSELAADLTSGARVSLPGTTLALQTVSSLDWLPDGRSVLAVVQAQDERGAQYTLGYEVDVVSVAGRWEVSAIERDPDAQGDPDGVPHVAAHLGHRTHARATPMKTHDMHHTLHTTTRGDQGEHTRQPIPRAKVGGTHLAAARVHSASDGAGNRQRDIRWPEDGGCRPIRGRDRLARIGGEEGW